MMVTRFVYVLLACCMFSTFGFNVSWDIYNSIKMPSINNQFLSSQLVCELDETIYFIGGRMNINNTFRVTNNIYMLNKKTNNTFEKIATKLPGNGAYFASNYICMNGRIYMFGTAYGELLIFNIDTQTISNISFPSNAQQVSLPCVAIQDDCIFIIGGKTNDSSVTNQMLQFNISSNTFINFTYPAMPNTSYASMCYVLNDTADIIINGTKDSNNNPMLYVLGGESDLDDTEANKNIYQFNISSHKWTTHAIATLSEPRSFSKSIYYKNGNFILIIGAASPNHFSNTCDIFYLSNYSVMQAYGDELPYQIEFNTVSKHENKIFVWGGYAIVNQSKENLHQIFVFNLAGKNKDFTWTSIGLIAGACGMSLICGGCAYFLCARATVYEDDGAINYRKYQK